MTRKTSVHGNIEAMKNAVIVIITLLLSLNIYAANTNLILVRHAEKEGGSDPALTSQGRIRANALIGLTKLFNIEAVYTSSAKRTIQTGTPLANHLKLTINSNISP